MKKKKTCHALESKTPGSRRRRPFCLLRVMDTKSKRSATWLKKGEAALWGMDR